MPAYSQRGVLPHGPQAEISLYALRSSAEAFAASVDAYVQGEPIEPLAIEINLDGRRLTGQLIDRYAAGITKVRYGRTRGKDLIALWICHLAQAAAGSVIGPKESRLICKDKVWRFAPILAPDDALVTLTRLYEQGQSQPIHYFPESSFQYARSKYLLGRSETLALKAARNAWKGNDFAPVSAESKDPYFDICFRYTDPIDDTFQEHTRAVWRPLLKHLSEIA
jgi:exodeoxyribonuclease V gamma subunit